MKKSTTSHRSWWLSILAFLCVVAVGCGSSNDEFVTVGDQGNQATTGTLRYLLEVNNVTSVPAGTSNLQFDLFDSNNTLIMSSNLALDDQIDLSELPDNVNSTTVTAFDEDGFPIGTLNINSPVTLGGVGEVDLSQVAFTPVTFDSLTASPDPVELTNQESQQLSLVAAFSNGSTANLPQASFSTEAGFQPLDTDVANVSATGLITGVDAGNTTLTATYTINNVPQQDIVTVNVSTFDAQVSFGVGRVAGPTFFDNWTVSVGGSRQPNYVVTLTGPDGQSQTVAPANLSFAFDPAVSGFSVTNTGEVSVAQGVSSGTTANLVVSFTDSSNRVYSDIMVITAGVNE